MSENFNQHFTKLENWQILRFNSQVGITDPVNHAYKVDFAEENCQENVNPNQFCALLQDPQASQLQALVCWIGYDRRSWNNAFGVMLEALCDAREKLPNLVALFIGDWEEHEYRKSKLHVFDIRPILEAYPKLEVLQVRGRFDEYELECKSLRHERLKTLIIETADLNQQNLAQICNLELPALEYLELWLGRQLSSQTAIDSLLPILLGDSFPNLIYLGLLSSENTNSIANAVAQSSIIKRLAALDLSMGNLTDAGARILLNSPEIKQIKWLNVTKNRLSANMIQQLVETGCCVIADAQQEGEYYNNTFYGDRYSALHE